MRQAPSSPTGPTDRDDGDDRANRGQPAPSGGFRYRVLRLRCDTGITDRLGYNLADRRAAQWAYLPFRTDRLPTLRAAERVHGDGGAVTLERCRHLSDSAGQI